MNYISSTTKPNVTEPVATTITVLFGNATTEFDIQFFAKMTLSDVKIQMRKHGGFTDEEINNYAAKIKAQLNQWNEAADFPSTYTPLS